MANLVTAPLRFGLQATRMTVDLSVGVAGRVAGGLIDLVQSQLFFPQRDRRSPSAADPPAPTDAPAGATADAADAADAAAGGLAAVAADETEEFGPPAEVIPITVAETITPEEGPDTPLSEAEAKAKTIDDHDELVGEYAETGAEDGAGAQIHFDEPWDGYAMATATDVAKRLADSDAAEIAVVELYEQAHKARRTVLDAAAKRLRDLSAG